MNRKLILLSAIFMSVITMEQAKAAKCPKGINYTEFEMYVDMKKKGYRGWALVPTSLDWNETLNWPHDINLEQHEVSKDECTYRVPGRDKDALTLEKVR